MVEQSTGHHHETREREREKERERERLRAVAEETCESPCAHIHARSAICFLQQFSLNSAGQRSGSGGLTRGMHLHLLHQAMCNKPALSVLCGPKYRPSSLCPLLAIVQPCSLEADVTNLRSLASHFLYAVGQFVGDRFICRPQ